MDIIALQRYVRVSPKKMRFVADVTKKMSPIEAVEKLPFLRKRGSEVIIKVIKSALASAKQKGLSDDTLFFKEIQIGEGPRLKRGRAASRGRWHPYKRRMSHVRIVLTVKEQKNMKPEAKKTDALRNDVESVDKKEFTDSEKEKPIKVVGKTLKKLIPKRKNIKSVTEKKGENK